MIKHSFQSKDSIFHFNQQIKRSVLVLSREIAIPRTRLTELRNPSGVPAESSIEIAQAK
jgi:hypothetical protein